MFRLQYRLLRLFQHDFYKKNIFPYFNYFHLLIREVHVRARQRGRFGLRQLLGDRPRPHPDRPAAGGRQGHPRTRRHPQLQGLRRRQRALHVSRKKTVENRKI